MTLPYSVVISRIVQEWFLEEHRNENVRDKPPKSFHIIFILSDYSYGVT
jgi:hypothetical protein